MFGRLKTSHIGLDEVPTGTHGIFSESNVLIGSLVVESANEYGAAVMEKWRWKEGYDVRDVSNPPPVSNFYLKCRSGHTVADPKTEYHYVHGYLPGKPWDSRPLEPNPCWRQWKLTRSNNGGADIGYFRLDLICMTHYSSHWFIDPSKVGEEWALIPLDKDEVMTFTSTTQTISGQWRYLGVNASKYPGSG